MELLLGLEALILLDLLKQAAVAERSWRVRARLLDVFDGQVQGRVPFLFDQLIFDFLRQLINIVQVLVLVAHGPKGKVLEVFRPFPLFEGRQREKLLDVHTVFLGVGQALLNDRLDAVVDSVFELQQAGILFVALQAAYQLTALKRPKKKEEVVPPGL